MIGLYRFITVCVKKRLESVSVSISISGFRWLRKVFHNHSLLENGYGRPSVTIYPLTIISLGPLTETETDTDSGRFRNQITVFFDSEFQLYLLTYTPVMMYITYYQFEYGQFSGREGNCVQYGTYHSFNPQLFS